MPLHDFTLVNFSDNLLSVKSPALSVEYPNNPNSVKLTVFSVESAILIFFTSPP